MYSNDEIGFRVGDNNTFAQEGLKISRQATQSDGTNYDVAITAPKTRIEDITDDKSLVTKEYLELGYRNFKYSQAQNFSQVILSTANTPVYSAYHVFIRPRSTSSKIKLDFNVTGEWSTHPWNAGVVIKRVVAGTTTTVLRNPYSSTYPSTPLFPFMNSYGNDNSTTPDSCAGTWVDSPNTTSQIEYRIGFVSSSASCNFYFNRTRQAADGVGSSSFFSAEEILPT